MKSMKLLPVKIERKYKKEYALVSFEAITEVKRVVNTEDIIERDGKYYVKLLEAEEAEEKNAEKFKFEKDNILEVE